MSETKPRVLVVGGASGIGRAVVDDLRDEYQVETASRRAGGVTGVAHHQVDASDSTSLHQVLAGQVPYDHLIVTAAHTPVGSLADLTDEQATIALRNKLWLSYVAARDIPWTKSLTLTSGYLAAKPGPASALQSALNGGIEALVRAVARERRPARVNCVSPGTIESSLWDALSPQARTAALEVASTRALLGRPGRPAEVAKAIRFTLECTYVTGEVIYVDGGARFSGP